MNVSIKTLDTANINYLRKSCTYYYPTDLNRHTYTLRQFANACCAKQTQQHVNVMGDIFRMTAQYTRKYSGFEYVGK